MFLNIITIILIAISLSMDAFSLALIYGTGGIKQKEKLLLSLVVGFFHFIMPLIGLIIGNFLITKIPFNINIITGIILSTIAIEMIVDTFKLHKEKILPNYLSYILFGLSVSIDSLTTGIGLRAITNSYILSSVIFSLISFLFTYLGLNVGNAINIKYGKIATLIGGIILFILGLIYMLK